VYCFVNTHQLTLLVNKAAQFFINKITDMRHANKNAIFCICGVHYW